MQNAKTKRTPKNASRTDKELSMIIKAAVRL
jgi:hypothetical protein